MTALEIILIILIILFVGGVIAWRVFARVRGKKKGASSGCGCGGACSNCPSGGACSHGENSEEDLMPDIHAVSDVSCDLSDVAEQMNARKK